MIEKEDRLPVSFAPTAMGLIVRWKGELVGLILQAAATEWWTPYSVRGYPMDPHLEALDAATALKAEFDKKS